MNIEKEREAFEKSYAEMLIGGELKGLESVIFAKYLESGEYAQDKVDTAWCMWQAAKAQAVPEGYVLVEKTKLMQIVGSAAIIEPITRGNPLMSKYKTELDFILSTVRAMIEAQEQNQ